MGVIKEKGDDQGKNKRRFVHEELRGWYARRKVPQSGMVIPEQENDWTRRGRRRSLGTNRRQGNKIFLVAAIESMMETERPESVLGPTLDLAKIVV